MTQLRLPPAAGKLPAGRAAAQEGDSTLDGAQLVRTSLEQDWRYAGRAALVFRLHEMTERKSVDWEAIEREDPAGQLTVVEIGRQHGPKPHGDRRVGRARRLDPHSRRPGSQRGFSPSSFRGFHVKPSGPPSSLRWRVASKSFGPLGARFMESPSVFRFARTSIRRLEQGRRWTPTRQPRSAVLTKRLLLKPRAVHRRQRISSITPRRASAKRPSRVY